MEINLQGILLLEVIHHKGDKLNVFEVYEPRISGVYNFYSCRALLKTDSKSH
jgi:hypothetical protein